MSPLYPVQSGALVPIDAGLRGDTVPRYGYAPYSMSTRVLTAARVYLVRYSPSKAWAHTLAAFSTSTAGSVDDPVEIALYTAGSTFTRVGTTGAVTGKLNALGLKTAALAATVDPALVYYAAFVAATVGGTAPAVVGVSAPTADAFGLFGTTQPTAAAGFADGILSGGLLPATFLNTSVSWAAGITAYPLVTLREV